MAFTSEEANLLARLASGELDGVVGNALKSGQSMVYTLIENGIPQIVKIGPGGKNFNGKENESFAGAKKVLQIFKSSAEIIGFLQKFGYLMKDPAANEYSAKYKP